jgi:hypothetical protein
MCSVKEGAAATAVVARFGTSTVAPPVAPRGGQSRSPLAAATRTVEPKSRSLGARNGRTWDLTGLQISTLCVPRPAQHAVMTEDVVAGGPEASLKDVAAILAAGGGSQGC